MTGPKYRHPPLDRLIVEQHLSELVRAGLTRNAKCEARIPLTARQWLQNCPAEPREMGLLASIEAIILPDLTCQYAQKNCVELMEECFRLAILRRQTDGSLFLAGRQAYFARIMIDLASLVPNLSRLAVEHVLEDDVFSCGPLRHQPSTSEKRTISLAVHLLAQIGDREFYFLLKRLSERSDLLGMEAAKVLPRLWIVEA